MDRIEKVNSDVQAYLEAGKLKSRQVGSDFKVVLENFLREVNNLQKDADESIKKFVSGEKVALHDVMIAVQEAQISFQLMLELRNRLLEAYQEVMRMPV